MALGSCHAAASVPEAVADGDGSSALTEEEVLADSDDVGLGASAVLRIAVERFVVANSCPERGVNQSQANVVRPTPKIPSSKMYLRLMPMRFRAVAVLPAMS